MDYGFVDCGGKIFSEKLQMRRCDNAQCEWRLKDLEKYE